MFKNTYIWKSKNLCSAGGRDLSASGGWRLL